MSQQFLQGPKPYTASVDLIQYRAVKYAAGQNVGYAGAGDDVLGIVQAGTLAGNFVSIAHRDGEGTFKVTVAGVVADGDKLWPTGAVGKFTNGGVGTAPYTALEASTADGDIIEAKANIGSSESGGDTGVAPIIYSVLAIAAVAGTYLIATPKRKVRIINWWVIARDGTAANVKLQNGVTDATANIAKGTVNDTIVAGGTIIAAQANVVAGTGINVVTSGNSSVDVYVMVQSTL